MQAFPLSSSVGLVLHNTAPFALLCSGVAVLPKRIHIVEWFITSVIWTYTNTKGANCTGKPFTESRNTEQRTLVPVSFSAILCRYSMMGCSCPKWQFNNCQMSILQKFYYTLFFFHFKSISVKEIKSEKMHFRIYPPVLFLDSCFVIGAGPQQLTISTCSKRFGFLVLISWQCLFSYYFPDKYFT